jgi:ribonuclease T1
MLVVAICNVAAVTRRYSLFAGLALLVVALLAVAGYCARKSTQDSVPPPPASAATPVSGLPTIGLGELPEEAVTTLGLIDKGGPFSYVKDGSTFGNLERLLPQRERGYYREFTVPTPGSRDRGARRLVVGEQGDVYYTADHYESFRQVLR